MMTERSMTFATGVRTSTRSFALAASAWDEAVESGFEVDFLPAYIRTGQMRQITRAQLSHWDLTRLTDDATLVVSDICGASLCRT